MTREETKRKIIGGYVVELELFEEGGEQRSSCIISTARGSHSSSLAFVECEGTLAANGDYDDCPIKDETIDRIREWAEANGY